MSQSNPILALAVCLLERRLTPGDLEQPFDMLWRSSVDNPEEIQKWFRSALTPTSPTPLIEAVGRVCVALTSIMGGTKLIGRIYCALAGLLDQRNDRLSLSLAVCHYQEAREHLDLRSREYSQAKADEGAARLRLADLRICPQYNLEQAVSLCQQARVRFDPTSASDDLAQMNEENAWRELAELWVKPLEHLERAATLFLQAREGFDRESRDYGQAQANEGTVRMRLAELGVEPLKNIQCAIRLYQQARERFDSKSPAHGLALMHEGTARRRLAELGIKPQYNLEQAVSLYQQAQERFEPESPICSVALMNEGAARCFLVELGTAPLNYLTQAITVYEKAEKCHEPGTRDWGKARRNQVYTLWRLGRREAAYHRLEEGLKVIDGIRATMRWEQDRIAYLEMMAGQYATMVELCLDLAERAPAAQAERWRWQAWHWVHRGKSRALLELLANVRPSLTEQGRPLWEEYQRLAQVLDEREREIRQSERMFDGRNVLRIPISAERFSTVKRERDEANRAYQEKRNQVFQQIEGVRALQAVDVPPPEVVVRSLRTLAGINGAETSRALLVEFFMLSAREILVFLLPLWEEGPPLVERVYLGQGEVILTVGGLLEAIGKLQSQTRARQCQEEAPEVSAKEYRAALEQLEQLPAAMTAILEPWAHHLERWQPTHLFISPHFLLNLLPLHAALWKGQPLNEHFPISYLPSAALAEEIVRRRKPTQGEALLLGNPTGDLGGAEAEVAWVKKSLEQGQIDCRAFVRETATTNQMYTHAPSAAIIHSACHSSLDLDDFLESGLELADRKLRAFDVAARLQLQQAALVYLGSCDSGRAVVGRTDELMALIRVFLYAGSPAVIATLWVLDDGVGSFFADHFYKFWITDKMPMTVAFQMAMKETRSYYKNPFYWAPFVLMGG